MLLDETDARNIENDVSTKVVHPSLAVLFRSVTTRTTLTEPRASEAANATFAGGAHPTEAVHSSNLVQQPCILQQ